MSKHQHLKSSNQKIHKKELSRTSNMRDVKSEEEFLALLSKEKITSFVFVCLFAWEQLLHEFVKSHARQAFSQ